MHEKLVLPKEVQDWLDRKGGAWEYYGRKNIYQCDICGAEIVTFDLVNGVTPFMIECKVTQGCDGFMQSNFYQCDPDRIPTWEWYRPDSLEGLDKDTQEHVLKGGLLLRPIADLPQ